MGYVLHFHVISLDQIWCKNYLKTKGFDCPKISSPPGDLVHEEAFPGYTGS